MGRRGGIGEEDGRTSLGQEALRVGATLRVGVGADEGDDDGQVATGVGGGGPGGTDRR